MSYIPGLYVWEESFWIRILQQFRDLSLVNPSEVCIHGDQIAFFGSRHGALQVYSVGTRNSLARDAM